MSRPNILFFHKSGLFYGGTERLLQIFAKYLARDCNVFFAYAPKESENRKEYFKDTGVRLVPFTFESMQSVEPYSLRGMKPDIFEIIRTYHIELLCTPVSAHYQFPLNTIPASMPFIITSPFGHYATNGNVQMAYVSGQKNLERILARGIKEAQLVYDPLEDFPPEVVNRQPIGGKVVFGRLGRPDDNIFDPISMRAYAKLEQVYGDRVEYLVLSPPPRMRAMAQELGLKHFVVVDENNPGYWLDFYKRVDVLAHARLDGETFGKAIAEAMLAGLPILTHVSRYHNEHLKLLHESYAKVAELNDVGQYYEHMAWMVDNKQQIRHMGALARQRALDLFSVERIMPPIAAQFMDSARSCTYYNRGGWFSGYIKLWLARIKMFPFVFAKHLAHRFVWFRNLATRLYTRKPIY